MGVEPNFVVVNLEEDSGFFSEQGGGATGDNALMARRGLRAKPAVLSESFAVGIALRKSAPHAEASQRGGLGVGCFTMGEGPGAGLKPANELLDPWKRVEDDVGIGNELQVVEQGIKLLGDDGFFGTVEAVLHVRRGK